MSSYRSACLAAAALLAVLIPHHGVQAGGAPRLACDNPVYEFGSADETVIVENVFILRNTGSAPLEIRGVETSCGCTAALVSDKDDNKTSKFDPGKSGKIKIVFNSRGYQGEVTKYIYVDSDDPRTPRVKLTVTAAVDVPPQPRIDLDRYSHDAGLLIEGDDLEAIVAIKNRGELELKVECALQNASFLVAGKPAKFPLRIAAGKEAEVTIKLPLAERIGLVREFVLFKSNDPLRSTISMNLNGYVVTREQLKTLFEKYKAILK